MPQGCARGQNLECLIMFFYFAYFSFMDSFVFRQHAPFMLDFSLCDFGPQGTVPQGGARGQNLGHLNFFLLLYFSLMLSFVFKKQVLFRVDFLSVNSDCSFFCCFFIFYRIIRS